MVSLRLLFSGAALAVGLAGAANATVLYSTGFEPPAFTQTAINGQNGWAVYTHSGTEASAPFVQNIIVASGTQAVLAPGTVSAQTGPYYALTIASPGVIDLSADIFNFTPAGGAADAIQFAATGPLLTQYAGGIDITGTSIFAISGGFPVIGSFSDSTFHHVDLLLDYTTQTFDVKLDGATLASGLAFCGSNGACNGANVATFGDGLFDNFGGTNGYGVIDNFSIATVTGVPEPATWALLIAGVGLAGGALRRRAGKKVAA
jgi:hypothetical protein